jgi:hypothetical protein
MTVVWAKIRSNHISNTLFGISVMTPKPCACAQPLGAASLLLSSGGPYYFSLDVQVTHGGTWPLISFNITLNKLQHKWLVHRHLERSHNKLDFSLRIHKIKPAYGFLIEYFYYYRINKPKFMVIFQEPSSFSYKKCAVGSVGKQVTLRDENSLQLCLCESGVPSYRNDTYYKILCRHQFLCC